MRSYHLSALIDEAVAEHRHLWTARAEGLTAGEVVPARLGAISRLLGTE